MADHRDHVRALMPAASPAATATRLRLTVFISYSRADLAFADELAAALEAFGGFEVLIDRDDIHEGEEWRRRLGALIAESDTVVFVLSPKSATSPVCAWEVDEAVRLSKRILPVLAVPLGEALAPKALADLNYIRFDPLEPGRPRSFVEGVVALRRALNTDIGWLREHTRLLLRAQEWEAAGKPESRLLTGSDIADAKAWLDRPPKEAPPPTEQHREYIGASDKAQELRLSDERARANRYRRANLFLKYAVTLAIVTGAGAAGAGYIAFKNFREAKASEEKFKEVAGRLAALEYSKVQGQPGSPPTIDRKAPTPPPLKQSRGRFEGEFAVRIEKSTGIMQTIKPFTFVDARAQSWPVPEGFVSDGSSIPFSLWSTLGAPTDDEYQRATIVHDYYVFTKTRTWEETHAMFLEALIASGVSEAKAQTLYAGLLFAGPRWSAPPAK